MKKTQKIKWPHPKLPVCSTTMLTVYDDEQSRTNIIPIALIQMLCYDPLYIGVSIRPQRYSHKLLEKTLEFCVNLPGQLLLKKIDASGNCSGRKIDKFQEFCLTPLPCKKIKAAAIEQCYAHIECRIEDPKQHILPLGVHTLFIGRVVASWVNEEVLDNNGQIILDVAKPIIYVGSQRKEGGLGNYHSIGNLLETQGFSRRTNP